MKKENLSGQSRDEILEMILEETARNPYKSNKAARSSAPKSSRPVSHFKPEPGEGETAPAPKQQAKPVNPDITQVFSATEAEAEAARAEKDIMSEKIEAMRQKKLEGLKYQEQQEEERDPNEAKTEVRIFPTKKSGEESLDASDKIKKLQKEKAAAAKAAIQQKAEIENARRAQNSAPVQYEDDGYDDGYDDFTDDEKVNLFIPQEGEEEYYETGDTLTALSRLFQVLISVLFVLYMVFTFVVPIAQVSGESMEPTLYSGDNILTWSMGYKPSNGDLVIIDAKTAALLDESGNVTENDGLDCRIVKRIIAMGGDTVDIDFEKGEVKVNDTLLNEDYISEATTRDSEAFTYPLTVPEGYAFVLGDNRNVSKDSRHPEVGLIPVDEIVGKVLLRFFPFDNFGMVE